MASKSKGFPVPRPPSCLRTPLSCHFFLPYSLLSSSLLSVQIFLSFDALTVQRESKVNRFCVCSLTNVNYVWLSEGGILLCAVFTVLYSFSIAYSFQSITCQQYCKESCLQHYIINETRVSEAWWRSHKSRAFVFCLFLFLICFICFVSTFLWIKVPFSTLGVKRKTQRGNACTADIRFLFVSFEQILHINNSYENRES